jgi:hypothetical protein
MNRAEFLARLQRGLVGLPTITANEIVADYESHFADGAAAGRTEAQVAEALGDPDRLARELKAEASAKRWGQEQTASSAAGAVPPGRAAGGDAGANPVLVMCQPDGCPPPSSSQPDLHARSHGQMPCNGGIHPAARGRRKA